MAQQVTSLQPAGDAGREVIPFEGGVVAYAPAEAGGYWRLRWLELGRRRDTTARTKDEALAKAVELSERLNIGTPTSHLRARGEALVEHYLDRRRRPTRGTGWSQRHREEQAAYCRRFVLPVIADVLVRDLRPQHFQRIVDTALTPVANRTLRAAARMRIGTGRQARRQAATPPRPQPPVFIHALGLPRWPTRQACATWPPFLLTED